MIKALFDMILFLSAAVSTWGAALSTEVAWSYTSVSKIAVVLMWTMIVAMWVALTKVVHIDPDDLQ